MINLSVFDQNGVKYSFTNITLVQPEDVAQPGEWYAYWMPYQVKADLDRKSRE